MTLTISPLHFSPAVPATSFTPQVTLARHRQQLFGARPPPSEKPQFRCPRPGALERRSDVIDVIGFVWVMSSRFDAKRCAT